MAKKEMTHFSHEHPLILTCDDGEDHSDQIRTCDGCSAPISAPFYSCRDCGYYLHKECAELPNEMNHPIHPQHPLTLLPTPPYDKFWCDRCGKIGMRFDYRCSICDFDLDPICASASGYRVIRNKGMEEDMTHFSHDHPLILKAQVSQCDGTNHSDEIISCDGYSRSISGSFYSCKECRYFLHKACAELPNQMKYPTHPQHPLTLLSKPPYREGEFWCLFCTNKGSRFVYNCSLCEFVVDPVCALACVYRERNKRMEGELQHLSHEHPLILKAEETKRDGTNHSDEIISCRGCSEPISGPFYSCGECGYFLHKVCAELPYVMNHPMHQQHPLSLFLKRFSEEGEVCCEICRKKITKFGYNCSLCLFYVDLICASASHAIEDKCHQHPLIPLQLPISFPCHICRTEKKGLSYECNMCPFWVHQNCTASLPSIVKHSYHGHDLTLLQPVSPKYEDFSRKCDICHDTVSIFYCVYYCERCLFFAHVSCARSDEALQLLNPRNQNIEINQDLKHDGPRLALLPMQQGSMDLISWFAENYSDRDAISNMLLGFDESFIDRDINMKTKIKFFGHRHPLILLMVDDHPISEDICDACALPISNPSYGCIDCGYFLHKCCTELPEQILHPAHPQHQIRLICKGIYECSLCIKWSNGFLYKCYECENFCIDIKCASLLRSVIYEAHRHLLIPQFISSRTCSACGHEPIYLCSLWCKTCSFVLCFYCAMPLPEMKHRWDKHLFMLTYSPPENHHNEYFCELCEKILNPKYWHYYCHLCDQFTHKSCMLKRGADSNIKYGKGYKLKDRHEHDLALASCTYDYSLCNKCRFPMCMGYNVGLKCETCDFKIHLLCALNITTDIPN